MTDTKPDALPELPDIGDEPLPTAFDPTPAEMQTILSVRSRLANAKANAEQCTAARKGAEAHAEEARQIEADAHMAHADAVELLHQVLAMPSLTNINWHALQKPAKRDVSGEREQWRKLHHNAIKAVAEQPHMQADQKLAMIALAAEIRAAHPDAF